MRRERLVPLGCVQTARDADGNLLLARLARLDVYFGKAEVAEAPPRVEETRVVVQPDFSVIVIGLNLAYGLLIQAGSRLFRKSSRRHLQLGAVTWISLKWASRIAAGVERLIVALLYGSGVGRPRPGLRGPHPMGFVQFHRPAPRNAIATETSASRGLYFHA